MGERRRSFTIANGELEEGLDRLKIALDDIKQSITYSTTGPTFVPAR
jgi:hypothetical protein